MVHRSFLPPWAKAWVYLAMWTWISALSSIMRASCSTSCDSQRWIVAAAAPLQPARRSLKNSKSLTFPTKTASAPRAALSKNTQDARSAVRTWRRGPASSPAVTYSIRTASQSGSASTTSAPSAASSSPPMMPTTNVAKPHITLSDGHRLL